VGGSVKGGELENCQMKNPEFEKKQKGKNFNKSKRKNIPSWRW